MEANAREIKVIILLEYDQWLQIKENKLKIAQLQNTNTRPLRSYTPITVATWLRSLSYAAILYVVTQRSSRQSTNGLRDYSFLPKAVVDFSHFFLTEKFTQRLHITLNLTV